MPKEIPESLSLNDAAALIMNLSFMPGDNDLLDMLEYFREEAESLYDHAEDPVEKRRLTHQIDMHNARLAMAISLFDALNAELDCIRNGIDSKLKIDEDSFGSEKLLTASVIDWATHIGFGIGGWKPPRFWRKKSDRGYSTEYLDIIDDVVETFCVAGGDHYVPNRKPTNDLIALYVHDKYSQRPDKIISDKTISTIGTVVRPGLTYTTKGDPKYDKNK